jgi:hypothetical protein
MTTFIELERYRVETCESVAGAGGLDLRVVRKADNAAFTIEGSATPLASELLWMFAHGDQQLKEYATASIAALEADCGGKLWKAQEGPREAAP